MQAAHFVAHNHASSPSAKRHRTALTVTRENPPGARRIGRGTSPVVGEPDQQVAESPGTQAQPSSARTIAAPSAIAHICRTRRHEGGISARSRERRRSRSTG